MDRNISLQDLFPACHTNMDQSLWNKAEKLFDAPDAEDFPEFLKQFLRDHPSDLKYLLDLAKLELVIARVRECTISEWAGAGMAANPCLQLLDLDWKNVWTLVPEGQSRSRLPPHPGQEKLVIWLGNEGRVLCRPVTNNDLVALKLVVEDISVDLAARRTGYRPSQIWPLINQAVQNNILLRGQSRIQRDFGMSASHYPWAEKYLTADVFTLQWHVTQACDLQCRHCYGRESRKNLDLDRAIHVLDDFERFCRHKNVHGQISFTGGNPMLYPHLATVHQEAVDRGFTVGILGNPAPEEQLRDLQHRGPLSFYQLSLEGLQAHNDYIRGQGHFQSVLDFLDTLKRLGIFSMVMLTLTKANTHQVLDLAETLQGRVDLFTFNRLSTVGSGAYLTPADQVEFKELLFAYQEKAQDLSGVGFKDNLFNLVRCEQDKPLFGGCTGYGCGAAFNFVAVLCDGEVHACRKFPSLLGNIFTSSLEDIYDSQLAQRYREGPAECKECFLRPVCRGCLAVAYSSGLDVFQDKDPYCFF